MPATAPIAAQLQPLVETPAQAAVLLDVDGTLAPIVRHASDAHVPEPTRTLLIAISKRFGLVACVSGRQAADARRIVSIGSIAYLGTHGSELLAPGGTSPELQPEVEAWTPRVQAFARRSSTDELRRVRVRIEDKGPIAAFHWRGAPDEDAARQAVDAVATRAAAEGLWTHWGRKVLEVRPPVRIDKGAGIVRLLAERGADLRHAIYIGDDLTDLDAFRGLDELVADGRLQGAVRVAVGSDEGPEELRVAADVVVDGTAGVVTVLEALAA